MIHDKEATMVRAIREQVVVQPGGLLEIRRPDLPAGATVDVIVMVEENGHGKPADRPDTFASLFGRIRGCFETGEAADAFLRTERDSWPR